jgi:hypothetical protein
VGVADDAAADAEHPRLVFEQLLRRRWAGLADSWRRPARRNSILDSAIDEMAKLRAKLGPSDRSTVSDYLDVLRECERRFSRPRRRTPSRRFPNTTARGSACRSASTITRS